MSITLEVNLSTNNDIYQRKKINLNGNISKKKKVGVRTKFILFIMLGWGSHNTPINCKKKKNEYFFKTNF